MIFPKKASEEHMTPHKLQSVVITVAIKSLACDEVGAKITETAVFSKKNWYLFL